MYASLFILFVAFAPIGKEDPPEITRYTVDASGSMRCAGGGYSLSGSIGQPDAGSMNGGSIELAGGFWFGISSGDCTDDGLVNLIDYASSHTQRCLQGPNIGPPIPECMCFDLDGNGVIDLRDVAISHTLHIGH